MAHGAWTYGAVAGSRVDAKTYEVNQDCNPSTIHARPFHPPASENYKNKVLIGGKQQPGRKSLTKETPRPNVAKISIVAACACQKALHQEKHCVEPIRLLSNCSNEKPRPRMKQVTATQTKNTTQKNCLFLKPNL